MKQKEIIAALVQMEVGKTFEENLSRAKRLVEEAVTDRGNEVVDVVCLPEYFFAGSFQEKTPVDVYRETNEKTEALLKQTSQDYGLIVVGTVIEAEAEANINTAKNVQLFNTCMFYENGKLIGKQRKVHLTEGERTWGLYNSNVFEVVNSRIGKLGALVCADVLHPEAGRVLGVKSASIVFNPVISRFIERDVTKSARECIFVSRAYDNGYFVLKVGGPGFSPFGSKIAGRSLVASPWGIIASAMDENKEEIIVAHLDMSLLNKCREENVSLRESERVKEAYKPLIE
jgi:predicted amidohydrolase